MPNHVSNILTVKGSNDKVLEVIKTLLNEKGGVTFDNFAPMPEELRNTISPTRIVSQEEYDKTKKELEEKLANDEKVFSTSLPLTAEIQSELIKKYGAENWYDWALENWGTKWGAYDGYKIDEDSVFFLSAWSTPLNGIIKLSNKFPDVEIIVDYADEDFGHNVGQYTIQNGTMINDNVPEGGSLEAIRMALEITGGEDYYLGDMLSELTEEEVEGIKNGESDYYGNFITLVIEREDVDDNFPVFLNQYLLEKAVENEQFEYATKLRDILKVEI